VFNCCLININININIDCANDYSGNFLLMSVLIYVR
jgi:hypothetical protein